MGSCCGSGSKDNPMEEQNVIGENASKPALKGLLTFFENSKNLRMTSIIVEVKFIIKQIGKTRRTWTL